MLAYIPLTPGGKAKIVIQELCSTHYHRRLWIPCNHCGWGGDYADCTYPFKDFSCVTCAVGDIAAVMMGYLVPIQYPDGTAVTKLILTSSRIHSGMH